jgi:CelD/BcsL family acetyltransferase involved in cellulose biosynthesis
MLRTEVVCQLSAEPDDFQARWSKLAASCPYATVFQTPEWLVTWWHFIGNNRPFRSLYIIAIYEGDSLIGIAPLVSSGWYGLPIRRFSFMGAGSSDYGDFLAQSGREREVCNAVYSHIASLSGQALLDLREAREGGMVRTFKPEISSPLRFSEWQLEPCPCIDLPTSDSPDENWTKLLKVYSKKARANINYYDRALGKTFEVTHSLAGDDASIESAFSSLYDLHARRWNERWLPGVFANKGVQRFHIEAGKSLQKLGALRLRCITLDGVCVAVLYCFAFNGRTCYYQGGFEPELSKYSLGSVLIARALRGAIDEGHPLFDFLRGNEDYKRRWTNGQFKVNGRILVSKSRLVLAIAGMIHKIEQFVETTAKRLFAGGLIHKAKKPVATGEE